MPTLQIDDLAFDDLRRLYSFLLPKDRNAAKRALDTINRHIFRLEKSPYLGARYGNHRRLLIPFGQSPYIALYRIDEALDLVRVLHIMNSRENIPPNFRN